MSAKSGSRALCVSATSLRWRALRRFGANAQGDMYAQTKRCIEIIAAAIVDAGGELRHVTRTRIMVTDMTRWREAARAHGEVFADVRPGCTFVEVSAFIDPEWLVEIEASAVIG